MIFSYFFMLDIVLILSLIITIFCCLFLYRKLREIRKSENEIRKIIVEFTSATERANTSLLTLKKSSSDLTNFMQDKISEAKTVIEDLKFLNDQGLKVYKKFDSIESNSNKFSTNNYSNEIISKKNLYNSEPTSLIRSEMEKELINALEQSR
ncbi:MAG: hypothetical protein CMM49_06950 [Rhodospirillaceae bacterium]|nr:hypothetical protein [Rhodospirillaceae bacterium]